MDEKTISRRIAKSYEADDIAIEELEEQLSDELDDGVQEAPVASAEQDVNESAELVKEANELLASIDADKAELPDDKEIVSQKEEILNACKELEKKFDAAEKKENEEVKCASQTKKGIEDEIGDEAHGGDPSVSEIPATQVDCDTDKEVFPTNSEYVASITKRLDRVANALEKKGMKKMAFRIDQLSDKLEASIRK